MVLINISGGKNTAIFKKKKVFKEITPMHHFLIKIIRVSGHDFVGI